jgi:hypothetical protein
MSSINDNIEINLQQHKIDPVMLVDEVSSIEYYIGVSRNFSDTSRANWQIKKIWKDGSVWKFEFPDGNQNFVHIWDSRFLYTYTQ